MRLAGYSRARSARTLNWIPTVSFDAHSATNHQARDRKLSLEKFQVTPRSSQEMESTKPWVAVAVSLILMALLASCIEAKPTKRSEEKDPLLAMPSDPLHYIEQHQPAHHEEVANVGHVEVQPQQQEVREVHYETRLVQVGQPEGHEHEQHQPSEYVHVPSQQSGEISREYPGEILYLNQNNEVVSSSAQDQTANSNGHDLSQVAGAISHGSGMSATILTEIPINDMPQEVLERLKREYGVKVVATRERPGANLVINCDDYAHQEGSICSRQPAREQQSEPILSGYSYSAPGSDDPSASYTLTEQPHPVAEQSGGENETYKGQDETFGSRTPMSTEVQHEPSAETDQTEAGHNEQHSGPNQPEEGEHSTGFDEQPKGSEEEAQKQGSGPYQTIRKS